MGSNPSPRHIRVGALDRIQLGESEELAVASGRRGGRQGGP